MRFSVDDGEALPDPEAEVIRSPSSSSAVSAGVSLANQDGELLIRVTVQSKCPMVDNAGF